MMIDLEPLKQTLMERGEEVESLWPSLLVTVFSQLPPNQVGPHVASMVERYIQMIPEKILITAQIRDDIGKLSKQRITRDLKRLRAPIPDECITGMLYSSSEQAQPGAYGVNAEVVDTHKQSTIVQFEFPWISAEGEAVESFANNLIALLHDFPFSVATAGFGFSLWQADSFAIDQLCAMLPRYTSFDLTDIRYQIWMRNATPSPNWLTFLNKELMESLGGASALHGHAPEAQVTDLVQSVCIRASKYPPVGDINHQARDRGALPGVARFLKPRRIPLPPGAISGRKRELDVKQWLTRFDEQENLPWENR